MVLVTVLLRLLLAIEVALEATDSSPVSVFTAVTTYEYVVSVKLASYSCLVEATLPGADIEVPKDTEVIAQAVCEVLFNSLTGYDG